LASIVIVVRFSKKILIGNVPDGPITRSRAKKIKEAMQGLVQSTWDEASKSPTIKVGLKEGEPILIHLIHAVEDIT
jgi:hypothetical protein